MVTTKKAAVESEKKKGELMENDQDAMEVMEMYFYYERQCAACKRQENGDSPGIYSSLRREIFS